MEYIVTAVKELTKKRRLVYVNYEPAFALYVGELKKYEIAEMREIQPERYQELIVLLSKRATLRALNLLKNKDYAQEELTRKLRDSHYPSEAIDQAVHYAIQYGYIDDYRYASNYVAFKADGRSRRQIVSFLQGKGIAPMLIEQVCEEYYSENSDTELQLVIRQMKKKLSRVNPADFSFEQRQKLLGYFYRKGFRSDVIKKALDIVVDGCDCY